MVGIFYDDLFAAHSFSRYLNSASLLAEATHGTSDMLADVVILSTWTFTYVFSHSESFSVNNNTEDGHLVIVGHSVMEN